VDRPSALTPPIACNQPDDVAEVRAEPAFRLHVRFFDGISGKIDMSRLIHSPNAGVFAALADPQLFATVGIEFGAVTWPSGLDLAPDAMYAALKAHGTWQPE
jgi:hypothetical protein